MLGRLEHDGYTVVENPAEADLLLHVVDGVNPERREQMQEVDGVLAEIHAEAIPQIIVYNKIDLTGEPAHMERDESGRVVKVWMSAKSGEGMESPLPPIASAPRCRPLARPDPRTPACRARIQRGDRRLAHGDRARSGQSELAVTAGRFLSRTAAAG